MALPGHELIGQRRVQPACAQRDLNNIPIPENALTRCNWNFATSPNVATRNLSIIDCVGILVTILSYRRGSYFGILLGSSGALFSLIVFLVIFFLELSPADAKDTIPVMIFGYFAVAITIAAIEIQKLRKAEILGFFYQPVCVSVRFAQNYQKNRVLTHCG